MSSRLSRDLYNLTIQFYRFLIGFRNDKNPLLLFPRSQVLFDEVGNLCNNTLKNVFNLNYQNNLKWYFVP